MKNTRLNPPLDTLTEDQQIDLVIVLGAFASSCLGKIEGPKTLSLDSVLVSCLQLYDMNLLFVQKKKGYYRVVTTELPLPIIQHLVDTTPEAEGDAFLLSNAVQLAHRFVTLAETDQITFPPPRSTRSKRKKKRKND